MSNYDPFFYSRDERNMSDSLYDAPTFSDLLEVSEYLIKADSYNILIPYLISNFGYPNWDYSITQYLGNGFECVTVPLTKDSMTSAMIHYYTNDSITEVKIVTRLMTDSLAQTMPSEENIPYWIGSISKFIILDYLLNDTLNLVYDDWLKHAKSVDSQIIGFRCTSWETEERELVRDENGHIIQLNLYYFVYIDCDDGGGMPSIGGDGISESGEDGGSGSNNNNSNNSNTGEEIEIDDDLKDCFERFDFVTKSLIRGIVSEGEVVDPCNPELSTKDIINNLIAELCLNFSSGQSNTSNSDGGEMEDVDNSDFSVESQDFISILNDYDFIVISPTLSQKCPKASCVLGKLLNNEAGVSTSFICSILNGFENNGINMVFHAGPFDTGNHFGAITKPVGPIIGFDNMKPKIEISFNSNLCENSSALDIFETYQHELVHAHLFRLMFQYYNLVDEVGQLSINQAFDNLVEGIYGPDANVNDQHELMLDYFVTPMVNSLIELNGGIGTFEDFEWLILDSFDTELLADCGYSTSYLSAAENRFRSFILSNGVLNTQLTGCDS